MGSILLVDDKPAVLDTVELVLRKEGHEITSVDNGPAAIEILKAGAAVDILITDIRMSPMHGLEVIGLTRKLRPDVEILIMSAYNDKQVIDKALAMGAVTFIRKPLKMRDFVVPVREIMARRGKGPSPEECPPIGDEDSQDFDWIL